MRESNHTPGPLPAGWTINRKWGLTLTDEDGYSRNIADANGRIDLLHVAVVLGNYGYTEHAKAWLMSPLEAAAPDLLEALENIISDEGPIIGGALNHSHMVAARAAIAKAKGERQGGLNEVM